MFVVDGVVKVWWSYVLEIHKQHKGGGVFDGGGKNLNKAKLVVTDCDLEEQKGGGRGMIYRSRVYVILWGRG